MLVLLLPQPLLLLLLVLATLMARQMGRFLQLRLCLLVMVSWLLRVWKAVCAQARGMRAGDVTHR